MTSGDPRKVSLLGTTYQYLTGSSPGSSDYTRFSGQLDQFLDNVSCFCFVAAKTSKQGTIEITNNVMCIRYLYFNFGIIFKKVLFSLKLQNRR